MYSSKTLTGNGTYKDNNNNNNRNQFDDFYNTNSNYDRSNNNRYDDRSNSYDRNEFSNNFTDHLENGTVYEKFDIFESNRYGGRLNLLFQDNTRHLTPIKEEDQNYGSYLGESLDIILGVRQCPVGRMALCVTSDAELDKCVKMRTALKAQLIKPEMICYKAHSHINCMQAIQSGVADVAVLDASDVYTAGLRYNLIPFISEVYNLGEPEYYVGE